MTITLIKPLEMLRFALAAEGVPEARFVIAESGGVPAGLSDQYCLAKLDDGRWECFYSERGQATSRAVFDSEKDAAKYFYFLVTGAAGPWAHREALEAKRAG